jgi:hypothetical protein
MKPNKLMQMEWLRQFASELRSLIPDHSNCRFIPRREPSSDDVLFCQINVDGIYILSTLRYNDRSGSGALGWCLAFSVNLYGSLKVVSTAVSDIDYLSNDITPMAKLLAQHINSCTSPQPTA